MECAPKSVCEALMGPYSRTGCTLLWAPVRAILLLVFYRQVSIDVQASSYPPKGVDEQNPSQFGVHSEKFNYMNKIRVN
jgi:hypothetical protein